MNYITKDHKGYTFDQDYKQIFKNKWNNNIAAQIVVGMRTSGAITDEDMKMLKFLFQAHFATAEMLYRLIKPECKMEAFEARLEKHVKNRVLNKFALCQYEGAEQIPDDALCIYCLDVGGKILLSHFSNFNTTNWYTIVNMKCPELITRDLVAGNFLIKLYEDCPEKIKFFKTETTYRIGRSEVIFSFELGLIHDNQLKYFVGEVVRDYDYPLGIKNKLITFENILNTNAVKKYFAGNTEQPIFIALCENDRNLKESFGLFDEMDIDKIIASTDKRMERPLGDKGAFIISNKKGALGEVELSVFKK